MVQTHLTQPNLFFINNTMYNKTTMVREWVVFALCLGLGAHVALGVLLHGSLDWPTETFGLYGIFFGLGIYGVVQVSRSVWRIWQEKAKS